MVVKVGLPKMSTIYCISNNIFKIIKIIFLYVIKGGIISFQFWPKKVGCYYGPNNKAQFTLIQDHQKGSRRLIRFSLAQFFCFSTLNLRKKLKFFDFTTHSVTKPNF